VGGLVTVPMAALHLVKWSRPVQLRVLSGTQSVPDLVAEVMARNGADSQQNLRLDWTRCPPEQNRVNGTYLFVMMIILGARALTSPADVYDGIWLFQALIGF
jgi:hypothetical protein